MAELCRVLWDPDDIIERARGFLEHLWRDHPIEDQVFPRTLYLFGHQIGDGNAVVDIPLDMPMPAFPVVCGMLADGVIRGHLGFQLGGCAFLADTFVQHVDAVDRPLPRLDPGELQARRDEGDMTIGDSLLLAWRLTDGRRGHVDVMYRRGDDGLPVFSPPRVLNGEGLADDGGYVDAGLRRLVP